MRKISWPNGLTVEREVIEVTSSCEPDFTWAHTDEHGHEHRWAGTWDKATTPTLRFIVDFEGDEEMPDTGHYECVACGDRVPAPRTTPSPYKRYMAGVLHCTLNGEPISEQEARAMVGELP